MQFKVGLHEVSDFARKFWSLVKDEKVFAFDGQMGAGKTTMIAAICHEKGVKESVSSPTFSIINEYRFDEDGQEKKIYHIDLYRLKDDEEIMQTGVEDCVTSGEICFVEWPEKAPWLLQDAVKISVMADDDGIRLVQLDEPLTRKS